MLAQDRLRLENPSHQPQEDMEELLMAMRDLLCARQGRAASAAAGAPSSPCRHTAQKVPHPHPAHPPVVSFNTNWSPRSRCRLAAAHCGHL